MKSMKKSKRIKVLVPEVKTREEMERVLGEIAKWKNFETITTALMNQRITEVRTEYEAQLADASDKLKALVTAAKQWADTNPGEFEKRKSVELVHGTVGYRTGMPKVEPKGKLTWKIVLERIKSLGKPMKDFIRTKEEVDKDLILANRANLFPADLDNMGVEIVQDEVFYVDPKLTEVENRETAEAA